jgi:hypothetical protein
MEEDMGALLAAILAVEGWQGPGTRGAAGEIGPYQITYAYWQDSKMPGRFADCESKEYSQQVMERYWKRYCPGAWLSGDLETLAAVHHFGPKGVRLKEYKDDYVARVMAIMGRKVRA